MTLIDGSLRLLAGIDSFAATLDDVRRMPATLDSLFDLQHRAAALIGDAKQLDQAFEGAALLAGVPARTPSSLAGVTALKLTGVAAELRDAIMNVGHVSTQPPLARAAEGTTWARHAAEAFTREVRLAPIP